MFCALASPFSASAFSDLTSADNSFFLSTPTAGRHNENASKAMNVAFIAPDYAPDTDRGNVEWGADNNIHSVAGDSVALYDPRKLLRFGCPTAVRRCKKRPKKAAVGK